MKYEKLQNVGDNMQATIVKKNKFLPLLTDTLPYEVPIPFSNRGFYKTIKEIYNVYYNEQMKKVARGDDNVKLFNNIFDFVEKKGFGCNLLTERIKTELSKNFTIPYSYSTNKNEYEKREMSLIHPFAQLKICDFYANYESVILYNTNKSNFSLRYPFRISPKILKELDLLTIKLMEENASFIDTDINEVFNYKKNLKIENIPNTYFLYKKYPILYEFYNSYEFLDLEQKFKYCFKFDIQKCFNSIYTHSICWAIKNKSYAKVHIGKNSFENSIDKLMQYSNWNETNGIPIGSEFSRIFAEILLQKIDQEIEKQLKIKQIHNFCIKRYVDDYFVFVNDKDVYKYIINLYDDKLKEYKLFINKSKNKELERPFITNISAAKQKAVLVLKDYLKENNLICNKKNKSAKTLLNQIRTIIFDNKVNMADISNILLSIIFKNLINFLDSIDNIQEINIELIEKYFCEIINLSFYIFNLSLKPSSTIGICKICIVIIKILNKIEKKSNVMYIIKERIPFMIIKFFENKVKANFNLIDYLDLIWILDICEYKIPKERLKKILNISNSYFEFMILLSYIKDNEEYDIIKKDILKKIKHKFEINKDIIFNNTETFLLFFDSLKCKWIDDKDKKEILDIVSLKKNKEEIISFVKSKEWFFTWENDKINLITLFEVKKSKNAYVG